jgi:hypothetical protein
MHISDIQKILKFRRDESKLEEAEKMRGLLYSWRMYQFEKLFGDGALHLTWLLGFIHHM